MTIRNKLRLLTAKLETNYGVAEALTRVDAILVAGDLEITPLAGETVSREINYPYFGAAGEIPVNSHQTVGFKVEATGSGVPHTAPAYGSLLRACGFAETITANTAGGGAPSNGFVTYNPISANIESLTIGFNIDGQHYTLTGAVGTVNFTGGANVIPYLEFTFTGLWNAPTTVAQIANPDFTDFALPMVGSNLNTPEFTLFGNSDMGLTTYNADIANEIEHREIIGAANQVILIDRAANGSVTVDAPRVADLDFVSNARNATEGTFRITHGSIAGRIFQLDAPKVRALPPTVAESSGIQQWTAALSFIPDTGNDELIVTVR